MRGLFPVLPGYLYYIGIAIYAICLIHCLRNGNQQKWLYIIIFVPLVGCIAYLFVEILGQNHLSGLGAGLGNLFFSPAARIRKLEHNLKFTDTFNNRVMLADAYLQGGRTDEAIELYESSLQGAFEENEHVQLQLIEACFRKQRYGDVIRLSVKMYARPQFRRSRQHIMYAQSLQYSGDIEKAEQEFKKMKGRFADFQARYQYGLFLRENGREEEARTVFGDITDEALQLSSRERRSNRTWIARAREELKSARDVSAK